MYCEKCGYKLRRGVKSCAKCGAPTPYNRSRSVIMIILAVLLTIAGLAAVVILDKEQALPVLIVDIVAALAILIGLFLGVKRGFLYGTLSTVLLVVVFALSIFGAVTLTPIIYDGIISETVAEMIDDAVSDTSPLQETVTAIADSGYSDTDTLTEILTSKLSGKNDDLDSLYNELSEKLGISPDELRDIVETKALEVLIGNKAITSESMMNCIELVIGEEEVRQAVDEIVLEYLNIGEPEARANSEELLDLSYMVESDLFEPLITCCLRIILFLIFVLICRFLMSLIMKIFRFLEGIHIPYILDLIFGTVEGIASGAAWICYAAIAVELVIIGITLWGSTDITGVIEDTISGTAVFRYLYDFSANLGL